MISVICPVLNEINYIKKLLEFFKSVYPSEKELIIIDGGSADGTKEIIQQWSQIYSDVILLNNPYKYVSYALNIGIKAASGDPIIRIDAHCDYSPDYFVKILETFQKTKADIVGGPTRIIAVTGFQKAVEKILTSKLGVGNNKIHDMYFNGYVDHVTFGAWRKSLFEEIGYFDEHLVRNQDDEFHYRAISFGKKIFLNSEIKLWYHPRDNYKGLFLQYFQYGFYKPFVFSKVKSSMRIRHLIPSSFILYLLILPFTNVQIYWIIPLFLYLLLIGMVTLLSRLKLKIKFHLLLLFPLIHISYGLGFIFGLFSIINIKNSNTNFI